MWVHLTTTPARDSAGVLLVDDDAAVRGVVAKLLEGNGYSVLVATSPEEAIEIASRARRIDVLLTDVIMPRISGRDVAARVTASHPEIRVVYMSGYTSDALVPHGVLDGDVAFLPKPFSEEALVRTLSAALR